MNYHYTMINPEKLTIQNMLEKAAEAWTKIPSLNYADSKEELLDYTGLLERVKAAGSWLLASGLSPGDHVAILGENCPNWGIAWLAISRAGCVSVPILPDFSATEIQNILVHSGARAICVSSRAMSRIDAFAHKQKILLINLDDLSHEGNPPSKAADFSGSDSHKHSDENSLVSIIYTSGTTGQPKGVMLTNRNLVWDALKSAGIPVIKPGWKIVSILPLSHTYEFTIGFLVQIICGTSIYYLSKPPAASILLPVLAKIRPEVMISVPLLIEKIYRQNILPKFTRGGIVPRLYRTTAGRMLLNRIAGKKLMKLFGGRLTFFGIGGAPLSPDVEDFLREARFPYAIGYGLTETSPLIAGSNPKNTVPGAIGPVLPGLELDIRDVDPATGTGIIFVKGPNVMSGYYRDEKKTAEILSADGWFNTGDLGKLDARGNLFVMGRVKTMILGSGGENIYPEHIEAMIDRFEFIEESLVLEEHGGGLVARVRINYESLGKHLQEMAGKAGDTIKSVSEYASEHLDTLKQDLNRKLSRSSRIGKVIEQKEPFDRTPTKKIKRYIYQALHFGHMPPEDKKDPHVS